MSITDPTQIPGLRLWLSARAAPGGDTTVWHDLSGHGYHAVKAGSTGTITNTGSGMVMVDGPPFNLRPQIFLGDNAPDSLDLLAAAELFISCTSTNYGGVIWAGGSGAGYTHHPYFDGNYYESFGSADRPGFPGAALGVPHRFHVLTSPTRWTARVNESVKYDRNGNNVAWLPPNIDPLLGSGGGPGGTYLFDGSIGCVLIYGRVLTDAERADVDAWLAANMDGGIPAPAAPAAPTGLTQTGATGESVTVAWTDAASGATGYQGRVDGGAPVELGDVNEWVVSGLDPAATYTVEVRAVGPGGVSSWVAVEAVTLAADLDADYRIVVRIGPHVWDVQAGDPPAFGPVLPVSFGWQVPDDALGFPAQPDPDTCSLTVITPDYHAMAGVDIDTPVSVSIYAGSALRPLASFAGAVGDLEAEPDPRGLSWRLLGVGHVASQAAQTVGASAWPQESGDDRAARIMAEAGYPGWTAPVIGSTFEAREPAPVNARTAMLDLSAQAVSEEDQIPRRVLVYPVLDADGELVAANPFRGAAVLRRVDALDQVSGGLVNRRTSWRRTRLLDASWVKIDHPGGPTVYGDPRGSAYPPQSVQILDPAPLADMVLDTTPGYQWLTGRPLRLEAWAADAETLAIVSHWFRSDFSADPFPWSGRAVIVSPIDMSPNGASTYSGMLCAATITLEATPIKRGRLAVEFKLRPDIPADSTVTMRWMDEPAGATWAQELADDPDGTWYDYYTRPRP